MLEEAVHSRLVDLIRDEPQIACLGALDILPDRLRTHGARRNDHDHGEGIVNRLVGLRAVFGIVRGIPIRYGRHAQRLVDFQQLVQVFRRMAYIDVRHGAMAVLQVAALYLLLRDFALIPPPFCCEIMVKLEQARSM